MFSYNNNEIRNHIAHQPKAVDHLYLTMNIVGSGKIQPELSHRFSKLGLVAIQNQMLQLLMEIERNKKLYSVSKKSINMQDNLS